MLPRAPFTDGKISNELARQATDHHGHLAIKPDTENRHGVTITTVKGFYYDWVQDLATLAMVKGRIGDAVPPGLTV
jgi:hypothetical protein